ncbi:MAG: hypothetical protein D6704_05520 [Nitrospirae bacterium]|nr:MAG: hypothetical protein D6704_05520 [Nitrospirota bacterium]
MKPALVLGISWLGSIIIGFLLVLTYLDARVAVSTVFPLLGVTTALVIGCAAFYILRTTSASPKHESHPTQINERLTRRLRAYREVSPLSQSDPFRKTRLEPGTPQLPSQALGSSIGRGGAHRTPRGEITYRSPQQERG